MHRVFNQADQAEQKSLSDMCSAYHTLNIKDACTIGFVIQPAHAGIAKAIKAAADADGHVSAAGVTFGKALLPMQVALPYWWLSP